MYSAVLNRVKNYSEVFGDNKIAIVVDLIFEKYSSDDEKLSDIARVVDILLPLKPDKETIISVFLYELYFDGSISEEEIKERFGSGVLAILNSLIKLDSLGFVEFDKGAQAEALRKMFLTMAKDLRVVLIWLAWRLLKMENLKSLKDPAESLLISRETMNIYVPLASRLGIYRIKTKLEDLAFQYIDNKTYVRIKEETDELGGLKKNSIEKITNTLRQFLESKGIEAEVAGRIKSIYSIYRKLKKKNLNFVSDIHDFFAIRVVLPAREDESVDNLYSVLGLIHSEWKPISHRFKDYLAVPKPNGYKSLHTVVLGLGPKGFNQPVEIQIRDSNIHREAEYGVASHWFYKDRGASVVNSVLESQVEWIRGLEKAHEFFGTDSDVIKEVELDVFKDRIFVLTPRGEVKDLAHGAIPLDFAYAVHTNVGNMCVMAKVNGSAVPLDYELRNGDVVEIITRKDSTPKLRWLSIVKTGFAKNKIKNWFGNLNRENNIKEGKVLINSQLARLQKPSLDQNYTILKSYGGANLTLSQRESLLEEVGKGAKVASDIIRKVYPYEKTLDLKEVVSQEEPIQNVERSLENTVLEEQIVFGGEGGLPLKIASCCRPRMGDVIIGYVTRGNRITIHKSSCSVLENLDSDRLISASWKVVNNERLSHRYRVGLRLTVMSRIGLIHDVTSIITEFGINIVDVMIKKSNGGLYYDYFLLDLDDLDKFDMLLDKLEDIKGVIKVSKDDSFKS